MQADKSEEDLLNVLTEEDRIALQNENQLVEDSVNANYKAFLDLYSQVENRIHVMEVRMNSSHHI